MIELSKTDYRVTPNECNDFKIILNWDIKGCFLIKIIL